jgi:hypothetical protein
MTPSFGSTSLSTVCCTILALVLLFGVCAAGGEINSTVTTSPAALTCASHDDDGTPAELTFAPVASCALSQGCQRTFCACIGSNTDASGLQCVSPRAAPLDSHATLTCDQLSRCHTNAILCFQQVAVLTAQSSVCDAFSAPLYQQMLAAAAGAPAALTVSCAAFRCRHYNLTRIAGASGLHGLDACPLNVTGATCPSPRSSTVSFAIVASDWSVVFTSARHQLIAAAVGQDIATRVGLMASVIEVRLSEHRRRRALDDDATAAPDLVVVLDVDLDTAVDYVLASLVNRGSDWLTNTMETYASFGGEGEFQVRLVAQDTSPPSEPPADDPNTTEPYPTLEIDSRTMATVAAEERSACGPICAIGVAIGCLLVLLVLAVIGFCCVHLRRADAAARPPESPPEIKGGGAGYVTVDVASAELDEGEWAKPYPDGVHVHGVVSRGAGGGGSSGDTSRRQSASIIILGRPTGEGLGSGRGDRRPASGPSIGRASSFATPPPERDSLSVASSRSGRTPQLALTSPGEVSPQSRMNSRPATAASVVGEVLPV